MDLSVDSVGQSTVSAHLGCLATAAWSRTERWAGSPLFADPPELMDLLASAETLLATTGQAVALCPTYGTSTAAREAR